MLTAPLLDNTLMQEEVRLEMQAIRDGIQRYRRLAKIAVERGDGSSLKTADRLIAHWYNPLLAAIRQEKREINAGKHFMGRRIYGEHILTIPSEKMAVITLHETLSRCMRDPGGVKLVLLTYSIGRACLSEMSMSKLRRNKVSVTTPKGKTYQTNSLTMYDRTHPVRDPKPIIRFYKNTLGDPVWNQRVSIQLGTCLVWHLLSIATLGSYEEGADFVPAFRHERIATDHKRRPAFIVPDGKLFKIIEEGHRIRETLRPRYRPMLVQPYPWGKDSDGGYVKVRTPFISKPTGTQKKYIQAGDLTEVYQCLNALTSTPWKINRRVYETMVRAWESGGGMAGIPLGDDIPLPPAPPNFDENRQRGHKWDGVDKELKKKWILEATPILRKNHRVRGDRMIFLMKLDEAKAFKERERFWFPHQLDFRGRCYPIPPRLNHHGDDVSRGLLEFADSRPIGADGLRWLKIHLANCYGIDKVSYDQRARWTDDHMRDVLASVADPFQCDWWQQVEDRRAGKFPDSWQVLAACFALADPNGAGSRLPVQLDGTCNGLQHYAAINRDPDMARLVNLGHADTPADVYSAVLRVAKAIVREDADAGRPEAQWVIDHLDRSLVKQPVMTSVYGVTAIGARKQVYEKIDHIGLKDKDRYMAAKYIANTTLKSLSSVCSGATKTMAWLKTCAKIISKAGHPVVWTTPLGLPVAQPYRKYCTSSVTTIMGIIIMQRSDENVPVAVGRQVDGFAPNFIHSIDAAHMLMTARLCQQQGIAFAEVHDSYWTHATHVSQLNDLLRRQFIEIHSLPLLAGLKESFTKRYELEFPDPPGQGTFDIHEVERSEYFFS